VKVLFLAALLTPVVLSAQGVTTAALNGFVTDQGGSALAEASVVAVHLPSGTQYRAVARTGGAYSIPNMKVGGPYRVTAALIGYTPQTQSDVFLSLGQSLRVDLRLTAQAVQLAPVEAAAERDEVLNAGRTGAASFIDPEKVALLPSIKRSTRDLTRLDPRSDGNFSFGGRNWLYNNISLDGSYFNNPFGLDDPAPGGQTNAEPVPYDAVEQVQVSVAPFDVREGGFTGANVNTVTKSGTNQLRGSTYAFYRNEDLQSNDLRGEPLVANPNLSFVQSGASLSGPLMHDKLFFFLNAEIERTDDPGTNFTACRTNCSGTLPGGVSRVSAAIMDSISDRMRLAYGYDTGPYEGFVHATDNDKLLARIDWNVHPNHNLLFRYNYLKASRELPPHPFVFSYNNTGRGPNATSLPFKNSGYAINNRLNSFALELNSRSTSFANRFFASYNRFRDFRQPFSEDFPTIEIADGGVTYTTVGHEPFSIHNVLDQDVWQFTDNVSLFLGRHVLTLGANVESFSFFNSFNLFRHGGVISFDSLRAFFDTTDAVGTRFDFRSRIATGPFKGEKIHVGQLGIYAQDEYPVSERFNLTYGVRVDFPIYFTDPVDNPFVRTLPALDENGNPEVVDQSKLPGATPLFSPRVGFNWNAAGDRRTQVRGGSGIFTGRVPFVWIGNVISNPGPNPNLPPAPGADTIFTSKDAILQQSFFINAIDPHFKWPQVWTTNLAIDQQLPGGFLGTLEFIYGKDIHSIFMRNANLARPVGALPAPDGRPYFGGAGSNELTPNFGAGPYVIDNTSEGHSINVTAQVRKAFRFGLNTTLAYSFTEAKNNLKSTEIASALWQNEPVQGSPNNPELSFSEFGQRHRFVGAATYQKTWSPTLRTQFGLFLELAEGNRFAGAGGNRYSFIYSGDVNGDGQAGNDLIYIPRSQSEIQFDPYTDPGGNTVTPQEQWNRLNAFVEQDDYLRTHRGQIAERFGAANPWYSDVDLRILQDFAFTVGANRHDLQLSLDILNVGNLLNSGWGVRKVASAAATSPLTMTTPPSGGNPPRFNFTGPNETFIDDPSLLSRWRVQIGLRYLLN
jgi:carboxypeptidase family protein